MFESTYYALSVNVIIREVDLDVWMDATELLTQPVMGRRQGSMFYPIP